MQLVPHQNYEEKLLRIDELKSIHNVNYIQCIQTVENIEIDEHMLEDFSTRHFGNNKLARLNKAKKIVKHDICLENHEHFVDFLSKHEKGQPFVFYNEDRKLCMKNISLQMNLYDFWELINEWEKKYKGGWFQNGCNLLIFYQVYVIAGVHAYNKTTSTDPYSKQNDKRNNHKKQKIQHDVTYNLLKNNGIIYKIQHKTTGRVYIGQTRQLLDKRLSQHRRSESKIGYHLRQEGPLNFDIEAIMICPEDKLDKFESFYIWKYNATSNGNYNCTTGNNTLKYETDFAELEKNENTILFQKISEQSPDLQNEVYTIITKKFDELRNTKLNDENEHMTKKEILKSHPDKTNDTDAINRLKEYNAKKI